MPEILIGIITAHHPSRTFYRECSRNTWLKDCPVDHIFVLGDAPQREEEGDEEGPWLVVDCPDDRKHMVLKNQGLFKYALSNDYDFCFRVCDDTQVNPERLMKSNLELYDYAGAMTAKFRFGPVHVPIRYLDYMQGGCGIWLSRKAMEMLVADEWKGPIRHFPPNIDMGFDFKATIDDHDWDDRWIGEVLKGNLAWDDPKRLIPYLAYHLNGINIHEDELMFYHDDRSIQVSVHDPGQPKTPSFITP